MPDAVPEPAAPPQPSALPTRFGTGLAATVCFAGAALSYLLAPDRPLWYAAFVKVGLVTAALWFALPKSGRDAPWAGWDWKAVGFVALCLMLSARVPQVGVPLLAAWWFWRWLKTPGVKTPRDKTQETK